MRKCFKVKYKTTESAKKGAKRFKDMNPGLIEYPENVYFCKQCNRYHISRLKPYD